LTRAALLIAISAIAGTAAVGLQLGPSAAAQSEPSRVIDRTLVCSTLVHAGVRKIDVYAASTVPVQKDHLGRKVFPQVRLDTGGPQSSGPGSGVIVGGATLVGAQTGEARSEGGSYFILSGKQCRASSRRVALSPRGLDGGRGSPLGETFECFPARRILVRTRAVFRSPTRLRRDRSGQLHTGAALREASFAGTTLSGKPLVYAEAVESGKARLFTAGSCVRD
jgi:hypothetical protein